MLVVSVALCHLVTQTSCKHAWMCRKWPKQDASSLTAAAQRALAYVLVVSCSVLVRLLRRCAYLACSSNSFMLLFLFLILQIQCDIACCWHCAVTVVPMHCVQQTNVCVSSWQRALIDGAVVCVNTRIMSVWQLATQRNVTTSTATETMRDLDYHVVFVTNIKRVYKCLWQLWTFLTLLLALHGSSCFLI